MCRASAPFHCTSTLPLTEQRGVTSFTSIRLAIRPIRQSANMRGIVVVAFVRRTVTTTNLTTRHNSRQVHRQPHHRPSTNTPNLTIVSQSTRRAVSPIQEQQKKVRRSLNLHQPLKNVKGHANGLHIILKVKRLHFANRQAVHITAIPKSNSVTTAISVKKAQIRRRATVKGFRSFILIRIVTSKNTHVPNYTIVIKRSQCHAMTTIRLLCNMLLGRTPHVLTVHRLSTNAKEDRP